MDMTQTTQTAGDPAFARFTLEQLQTRRHLNNMRGIGNSDALLLEIRRRMDLEEAAILAKLEGMNNGR